MIIADRHDALAELLSAKHIETFLIHDIEELQRWPVRLFLTLFPFLHGGRARIKVRGKQRLACFTTQPQLLDKPGFDRVKRI